MGEQTEGRLVYGAADGLHAVAFDLTTLTSHGTPISMVADVAGTQFGAVDAVVSSNGTLAYMSGSEYRDRESRTLFWVDRQGHETPLAAEPRAFTYPRLSPDGLRVAVAAVDRDVDIWFWDLARGGLSRATMDPTIDHAPVWTVDGLRLIFTRIASAHEICSGKKPMGPVWPNESWRAVIGRARLLYLQMVGT